MTPGRVEALRDQLHLGLVVLRNSTVALREADRLKRRGERAMAYRCPFGGHWHAGPISIGVLEDWAELLRDGSLDPLQ